jgi:hypothetical protein
MYNRRGPHSAPAHTQGGPGPQYVPQCVPLTPRPSAPSTESEEDFSIQCLTTNFIPTKNTSIEVHFDKL